MEHFAGLSGVRCALEVGCDIVIDAGEDNEIVIHVSGTFEQEVRVKIGVSGGAIWKWKWIFPYIADYRLNANIDAYTYTGIRVNATIGTFEKDAEWDWDDESKVQDIGKQIKELMDKKDEYVGDGIDTVAGTLADKYSKMLENDSDWIDLFEKEIFSQESSVDPFHILVCGVKVSFVVSAKMNISLGCDFYYENAKRYIFNIQIFSKKRSNDTINLVEEKYQFTFYVMGTLGLRAGIRLEVCAGLFSLKLDSIGFVAEVGAYVQLWGYFYYELTYTASTGKTSKYSGALYLEFGVYLEISFKAQLFNGTFEYNPTLYENQWPLLFAGSQQNVYDFSYSGDDTPKVSMAKKTTSYVLPDNTFNMSYMDMKTGETDQKTYDDSKDFTIEMTNGDFKYDPANNTVTVTPGSKITEDGEMIVTWKGAPLAFTSTPISRKILLHWDNLKSAYSISFNTSGGSAVGAISLPYNTAIKAPSNPQKMGYVFGGWYKDQNCTQAYTVPAKMPAEDSILYAKWTQATNTKYTVEHYQQNLNNDLYTLIDTDSLTGTTDANVSPARKTYKGFTAPTAQSITIKADGSAVLKYYYTRNSYTLTFNANGGVGGNTAQVKYSASIAAPIVTKAGYTLNGWSPAVDSTMQAQNTTYTAQWTASSAIAYKVEHYKQNINDNNYTLAETESLSGTAGAIGIATAKSYTGFAYDSNVSGTVKSGTIAGDGSLVLKLYYTRNSYTLTFDANGGTGGSSTQVKYGASIAAPNVTKAGYTLTGWSPAVDSIMPAVGTTYTAQWTADTGTAYKVKHYQQNVADNNYTLYETQDLKGATDANVTPDVNNYAGFTTPSTQTVNIKADGSTVVNYYYTRNSYTLKFDANGGNGGVQVSIKYGASITAPVVTKPGYSFSGWDIAVAGIMPAADTTYKAQWAIVNYKISFNKNADDATGSMADQSFSGSAAQNLTANGYTRTSYTFTGWNTFLDGSGTKYENKASVSSLTTVDSSTVILYAQWKPSLSSGIFNSQYSAKYQVFDFIVSGTKINGNAYDSSFGTAGASSGHQFSDAMLAGRYFVIRKTGDATNPIALYMYEADGNPVVQGTSANLYPSSLIGSDNNVNLTASCKTSLSGMYGANWAKGLVAVGNISSLWDEGFQFNSANGFGYFISGTTAYSTTGAITLHNQISNPTISQIEAVNDFEVGPLTAPN